MATALGEYIKVNLPLTEENYRAGNGEGVWVEVDEKTKLAYDSDAVGPGYSGILANDSCYYPGLGCGDVIPFEMRGDMRPVADFHGFLSKLNGISQEQKADLIRHIIEAHGNELQIEEGETNGC